MVNKRLLQADYNWIMRLILARYSIFIALRQNLRDSFSFFLLFIAGTSHVVIVNHQG